MNHNPPRFGPSDVLDGDSERKAGLLITECRIEAFRGGHVAIVETDSPNTTGTFGTLVGERTDASLDHGKAPGGSPLVAVAEVELTWSPVCPFVNRAEIDGDHIKTRL